MPNLSLELNSPGSRLLNEKKYVFPIIAIASFLFMLWRAKFGHIYIDEPYIISLAQRMFMGDALIADEWHVCQNTGPLLLPFYALFRLFSPDNEGLILFFRYVYCVFWWFSCLYIYKKLAVSEHGRLGPAIIFLYLILFAPLDYMAMSYTCIGLACCLFLCCILYHIPETQQKLSVGSVLFFSVLWIALTLCCPYIAAFFVLFLVVFAIGSCREKKTGKSYYFRNVWKLSLASLPVIALACIAYLYIFIFSRAELSQVLQNLPQVLNDPQHESRNPIKVILSTPGYPFLEAPVYVAVCFLVFAVGMIKKLKPYRLILFSVCAALYIWVQLEYSITLIPGLEPAVLPLNNQVLYIGFLGAAAFALLEKRPYKLFIIFQSIGWCYTVAQNFASNSRIYTIAMSLSVIGVCGILCCIALVKELRQQYAGKKLAGRYALALLAVVMSLQIGSELCTRCIRTTIDGRLPSLTGEIKYGSAKGIMTTPENADEHNTMYENLEYLLSGVDTSGKKFLCTSETPHVYLDADLDYGAFSSWNCFLGAELLSSRLETYLSINPEEQPDIVFSGTEGAILPFTDEGYSRTEYRGSYLFVKN